MLDQAIIEVEKKWAQNVVSNAKSILLNKKKIATGRLYNSIRYNVSSDGSISFSYAEEGKYVEKMGSIINLNYNNGNDIYDGQQRILTTILILNVMGCLSPKLQVKIKQLLTVDTELDQLTEEQEKIKYFDSFNYL